MKKTLYIIGGIVLVGVIIKLVMEHTSKDATSSTSYSENNVKAGQGKDDLLKTTGGKG